VFIIFTAPRISIVVQTGASGRRRRNKKKKKKKEEEEEEFLTTCVSLDLVFLTIVFSSLCSINIFFVVSF